MNRRTRVLGLMAFLCAVISPLSKAQTTKFNWKPDKVDGLKAITYAFKSPIPSKDKKFKKFKIDPTKDQHIYLEESGTSIDVPANAFVRSNGTPVTGTVEIQYREFFNTADILASGIPMRDKGGVFESGGMFQIQAKSGESDVFVKDGKVINVNLASFNNRMDYKHYYLTNTKKGDSWVETGATNIQENQDKLKLREQYPNVDLNMNTFFNLKFQSNGYAYYDSLEKVSWEYAGDPMDDNSPFHPKNSWVLDRQWKVLEMGVFKGSSMVNKHRILVSREGHSILEVGYVSAIKHRFKQLFIQNPDYFKKDRTYTPIKGLIVSKDKKYIAGVRGPNIEVYQTINGKRLCTIPKSANSKYNFTEDSNQVVIADLNTVRMLDIYGKQINAFHYRGKRPRFNISGDGKRILIHVMEEGDKSITYVFSNRGEQLHKAYLGTIVNDIIFSRDGSKMAYWGKGTELNIHDFNSNETKAVFESPKQNRSLKYHYQLDMLYVNNSPWTSLERYLMDWNGNKVKNLGRIPVLGISNDQEFILRQEGMGIVVYDKSMVKVGTYKLSENIITQGDIHSFKMLQSDTAFVVWYNARQYTLGFNRSQFNPESLPLTVRDGNVSFTTKVNVTSEQAAMMQSLYIEKEDSKAKAISRQADLQRSFQVVQLGVHNVDYYRRLIAANAISVSPTLTYSDPEIYSSKNPLFQITGADFNLVFETDKKAMVNSEIPSVFVQFLPGDKVAVLSDSEFKKSMIGKWEKGGAVDFAMKVIPLADIESLSELVAELRSGA